MRSRPHSPGADTRANIGLIFGSIASIVVLLALLAAILGHFPLLGWLGFGIASAIAFGLGAIATLAVPRARVSPPEPAAAPDQERRLLVVADPSCNELALRDTIIAYLEGAVTVHLVVPVRVSHLHFLTDDESDEHRDAEQTMLIAVGLLRQRRISASASVGTDKPLESMSDALGRFPATQVLLAVPADEDVYWLERDLLTKARGLTTVPVTQVVVPSTAPAVERPGARMSGRPEKGA